MSSPTSMSSHTSSTFSWKMFESLGTCLYPAGGKILQEGVIGDGCDTTSRTAAQSAPGPLQVVWKVIRIHGKRRGEMVSPFQ